MNRSYLIASALALAIIGWMAAGQLVTASKSEAAVAEAPTADDLVTAMSVETHTQRAESVLRHIVAQGQVEPNRSVTVRAETAGKISEVVARKGRPVQVNDVLVRLEMNDRQAKLKQQEALLQERRRAHESTKRLGEKGYQAQRLIDESYSALQAAEADLESIRLEIGNTVVRAPFDGVLELRRVELGDYVAINGEIATIVDNDPLVVTAQIAQQDIAKIALGDSAEISFATGQQRQGVVRYIAPRAEESTRTFRVEMEVSNADNQILSGISAEARIPTGTVSAHHVSPALLTLNDGGLVGVKTVNHSGVVKFHAVDIVLAQTSGIWVSGLPDTARIITIGQGFVRDGETVRTSPRESAQRMPGADEHPGTLSDANPADIEPSR
jgi:multidrug efflux system membrane fusion protein